MYSAQRCTYFPAENGDVRKIENTEKNTGCLGILIHSEQLNCNYIDQQQEFLP